MPSLMLDLEMFMRHPVTMEEVEARVRELDHCGESNWTSGGVGLLLLTRRVREFSFSGRNVALFSWKHALLFILCFPPLFCVVVFVRKALA